MHNAISKKNWWSHLVLSCGSSYTGTQSGDGVGMEREQEGRKVNKDEKMVKSRRKRKHQTGMSSGSVNDLKIISK